MTNCMHENVAIVASQMQGIIYPCDICYTYATVAYVAFATNTTVATIMEITGRHKKLTNPLLCM